MNPMTPAEELRKDLDTFERVEFKTIPYSKYLMLEGLLAMASKLSDELKTIERAAAEITGEENDGYDYFGHTTDAVYSYGHTNTTARQLLDQLEIEVEDALA